MILHHIATFVRLTDEKEWKSTFGLGDPVGSDPKFSYPPWVSRDLLKSPKTAK